MSKLNESEHWDKSGWHKHPTQWSHEPELPQRYNGTLSEIIIMTAASSQCLRLTKDPNNVTLFCFCSTEMLLYICTKTENRRCSVPSRESRCIFIHNLRHQTIPPIIQENLSLEPNRTNMAWVNLIGLLLWKSYLVIELFDSYICNIQCVALKLGWKKY